VSARTESKSIASFFLETKSRNVVGYKMQKYVIYFLIYHFGDLT
jgi:hypothetical protein